MSRLFSPKYEVNSIHDGIERDLQRFAGTRVLWYRFDEANNVTEDVYDYGYGAAWDAPIPIDVIDAVRIEGGHQVYEQGLYTRDRLKLVISWRELERRGFHNMMFDTQPYLKDRMVYDGFVFTPTEVLVQGQVQEWNTIVTLNCIEVRADELVNDPTFATYAAP